MLLLARYDAVMYEAFVKEGLEIGAWIQHVSEKDTPIFPKSVETVIWGRGLETCNVPLSFYREMDPAFARRVRNICYQYFVRMQDRIYWTDFERVDTWLDTNNKLESMIHYFYGLLKRNKITGVVSSNVPHEGPHIILHFIAKELGIPTYITVQSLEPNAFWMVRDIDDIGIFDTGIPKPGPLIKIDTNPKKPCYMNDVSGKEGKPPEHFMKFYGVKTVAYALPYILGKRVRSFKKNVFKIDQRRRYKYLNNIAGVENAAPNERYVYFPLHLQPEMTTDALGHEYCDQLLAVEELLRRVPDDVFIYIKENPKQTAQMREESFYRRMQALPNIRFLDREIDSINLIKNSEAVATITGTAGWEALQMGKPVITFGSAWYRALPGAFQWHQDFDYQQVINFRFDLGRFKEGVAWLSQFLRKGVVEESCLPYFDNFDKQKNAQTVAREVKEFIRDENVKNDISGSARVGV